MFTGEDQQVQSQLSILEGQQKSLEHDEEGQKWLMISKSGQGPAYVGFEGSGEHLSFILSELESHQRVSSQLVT